MQPSTGLRRWQREAAGVEIEVFPSDGENLADAKAGDGGEPYRGHLRRVLVLPASQCRGECGEFGRGERSVSRLLARALDTACRVRVLRTPLPRLEQREQPRYKCQHTVPLHLREWLDQGLDIATGHVADLALAQCRDEILQRLLAVLPSPCARSCARCRSSPAQTC